MTLNQLALEMWERLGYKEIDTSVLSRVLKGKRLLRLKQLNVLCQVLNISKFEKEKIENALFAELNERYGFSGDIFRGTNELFTDFIKDNLEKIKIVRAKDQPLLAKQWSEELYDRINERLLYITNENLRKELKRFICQLLLEKRDCIQITSPLKEISKKPFEISNEIKSIGKELGDSNLLNLSYCIDGNTFYILKKYREAEKLFEAGIKKIDYQDYNTSIISSRALALTYAYLKKEREFKEFKKKLINIMPVVPEGYKLLIIEGLARGEGILGNSREGNRLLEKGWNIINKQGSKNKDYIIHRKIQLIRTNLEIKSVLKYNKDKNYLEKIGKEGIFLTDQFGYYRYKPILKELMNKVLK